MNKPARKLPALFLVAVAAFLALPAAAHPGHGGKHRGPPAHVLHKHHPHGPYAGMPRRGELTRQELKKIRRHEARLEKMERRARRDGIVTAWEARRIAEARRDLSLLIHREANDRQRRW